MKSSLMKLNHVSTFSGKGQGVVLKKENQYSVVKEQGRVESPAVLLPKSTF